MLTRIYKEDKDTLKEYLMSRTQDLSTDVLTTVSNIIQDVKKNQLKSHPPASLFWTEM